MARCISKKEAGTFWGGAYRKKKARRPRRYLPEEVVDAVEGAIAHN